MAHVVAVFSVADIEPDDVHSDVDLLAASLQADAGDLDVYFPALCAKLTDALGARATVRRSRGILRRSSGATSLTIDLGDEQFTAVFEAGAITTTVKNIVRGISVRTDELSLAAWVQRLAAALRREAGRSEATRIALERLLT